MAQYARILNGIVVEIITATLPLNQLYTPDFVSSLVESDGTPGVAQGWTYASGIFSAPVAPVPTLSQRAATLLAGGLTVTSTGTPALNGVYCVQSGVPFGQEDIATEAQFVSTFSEFTNGGTSSLAWPLLNGSEVTFTSGTQFLNFAKAAAQAVAAVKSILAAGTGSLPIMTVTIP